MLSRLVDIEDLENEADKELARKIVQMLRDEPRLTYKNAKKILSAAKNNISDEFNEKSDKLLIK